MIDYVEIRAAASRNIIGVIDTAQSVIWHEVFFGVGDFEIYVAATDEALGLLKEKNYVTRPGKNSIGIIEKVEIRFDLQSGYMITASGTLAKSILGRRLIYQLTGTQVGPKILRGNVETAVRALITANAIDAPDTKRNIAELELGAAGGFTPTISEQVQTTADSLLEFTDGLLYEYGLAARVVLGADNKLVYEIYKGTDRSAAGPANVETVVFCVDYDNLQSCDYNYDSSGHKTTALIGGKGQDIDRFWSLYGGDVTGLARREVYVNSSSQNKEQKASELSSAYPSGTFTGTSFVVGGVVIAELVTPDDKEYSLNQLEEKFPSGTVSGTSFVVGGVVYGIAVYGKDNTFNITPVGYKAICDVDDTDATYEYTDTYYDKILLSDGAVTIRDLPPEETFEGEVNVTAGPWKFGEDYFLGDLVTIQDNRIGKYVNERITETTEVQDENGYTISIKFGS